MARGTWRVARGTWHVARGAHCQPHVRYVHGLISLCKYVLGGEEGRENCDTTMYRRAVRNISHSACVERS